MTIVRVDPTVTTIFSFETLQDREAVADKVSMNLPTIHDHPSSSSINAMQAFTFVEHEVASVADDELIHINIDIPSAVKVALAAADSIAELIPEIETLVGFDITPLRDLRIYAYACLHAHLVANQPPPAPVMMLEVTELRQHLLVAAASLAHFGFFDRERVALIRSGSGHVDMANALVDLARLFDETWATVQGKSPIVRAQVDRAARLGLEFLEHLGARRTSARARTRARAFTLFVRKYEQCRRVASFLRWDEGDADRIAPSLYNRNRRAGGKNSSKASETGDPRPTIDVVAGKPIPAPELASEPTPAPELAASEPNPAPELTASEPTKELVTSERTPASEFTGEPTPPEFASKPTSAPEFDLAGE